jgi:uncharacterized membrane protein (UPF0127 family)
MLLVIMVAIAMGVAPSCAEEPPATPEPAAAGTNPVVVRVGAAPPVTAEVADTPDERARGLMDREQLPSATGMIFVFAQPSTSSFYMFHTRVPLSIAFVDRDHVVSVAEMTPCPAKDAADCQLYPADGPYTLAVEAPGGHFTNAGVRSGDPVRIDGDLPTATK